MAIQVEISSEKGALVNLLLFQEVVPAHPVSNWNVDTRLKWYESRSFTEVGRINLWFLCVILIFVLSHFYYRYI